jgi:hypothetical protein
VCYEDIAAEELYTFLELEFLACLELICLGHELPEWHRGDHGLDADVAMNAHEVVL